MQALKDWLNKKGKSQTELAVMVGVRQPTVCDWVNGKADPSVDKLRKLSRVTGISVDELLDTRKPRKQSRRARESAQ